MTHTSFSELGLSDNLLQTLSTIGYETPSPIQAQSIPALLQGEDLLGQAQTGTGKTAAFALPLIQRLNGEQRKPQVLVLAPTRELAIQVAEAFQRYASGIKGFRVLPLYGGSAYDKQIRSLKQGVNVVVGTPGRVMDHLRKGTLKLDELKTIVLDEADEMLRMGFIDDVEWILEHTPKERQTALFSATMPKQIASVAERYLHKPVHVKIKVKTTTAETIRQRYWPVQGIHKLDAVTRLLEVETFSAMIVFVRTKTATVELAEKLEARGFRAAAINGDITQAMREKTIERLKEGKVDILVATDVAARGLDVERISHVLNYDIPYDTEAYVHRIGRTGRAGRTGEAILFVSKREMRMLRSIEKATGKQIEPMTMPSAAQINQIREDQFKQKAASLLAGDLSDFRDLVLDIQQQNKVDLLDVAAAFAKLAQGEQPLKIAEKDLPQREFKESPARESRKKTTKNKKTERERVDIDMETYRIDVGKDDGVNPGDIVGAIANEAEIDSRYIGHIKLYDSHSTVELPTGMPKEVSRILKNTWVCQKKLNLRLQDQTEAPAISSKEAQSERPKKRQDRKPRKRQKKLA